MSQTAPVPTPVPSPQPAPARGGWLKAAIVGLLGVGGGAVATYATAVVERVTKPTKPVANFAVTADGLTITCQNHASGESGWWDFGDGTPLEPFAPDSSITHIYTRPGTYNVKLTVRNYFGDESERTVLIEVAGSTQAAPPQITALAVQPVSPAAVAPATFRLTADVSNANSCVWDLGDGRLEVTEGGKIDRLVTFEKPGTFSVSLVAHNGKQGAKQTAPPVKVDAPRDGTTLVVLKVTDTGQRLEQLATVESIVVAVPGEKGSPTFSKTLTARPGYTIKNATPADSPASVKNVKVQVAADRRTATVSGEWAGDPRATNKAAGGSDAIVRVKLTEERTVAQQPTVTMVTGTLTGSGNSLRADLPLPPAPVGVSGARREFQIEVRAIRDGKSQPILRAPPTGTGAITLPWTTTQQGSNWSATYTARKEADSVVVTVLQTAK